MTNDTTSDDGHHNAPSKFKWLITYLSDCQRYFQVESSDLADTMTEVKEHRELNKPPILPPWDKGNTPPWGDGYNTVGSNIQKKWTWLSLRGTSGFMSPHISYDHHVVLQVSLHYQYLSQPQSSPTNPLSLKYKLLSSKGLGSYPTRTQLPVFKETCSKC